MNWAEIFAFDKSPLELFLRVSFMWWFIFLTLRFIMRRNVGEVGPADVLLLVLVADGAQNGMADEYKSITSAFIVVGTLFFWSWFLDWGSMRWKWMEKLSEPSAVLVVKHGEYCRRVMRKENISQEDIEAEIRKAGIENVTDVKYVRYESDGKFSVIPKDKG